MEIRIEHVSKSYGNHVALRDIHLQIENGMFGLLGPNGAGKTTLLRILATLIQPTQGHVLIDTYDTHYAAQRKLIRSQLGYLPQELGLYPDLTGREFLDYMGLIKQLYDRRQRRQQIEQLLEVVSLTSHADRKTKTYSGGMKRRLGIAQALLGDPGLVIVDEPTSGLDPEERIRLRTLLTGLARNRVVLLSTHVVEDISQTCDRLAMLNQGQLIFHGLTRDVIAAAQGYTWQFLAEAGYTLPAELSIISVLPQTNGTLYRVVGPRPTGAIRNLEEVTPSLEDGYVWLRQLHLHNSSQQMMQAEKIG